MQSAAAGVRRLYAADDYDDDYDYGHDGWDDYVETTVDPGNSLFLIALFVCLVSAVGLPLYVKIVKLIARSEGETAGHEPPVGRGSGDNVARLTAGDIALAARTLAPAPWSYDRSLSEQSYHAPDEVSSARRVNRSFLSLLRFVLRSGLRWRRRGAHAGEHMHRRMVARTRRVAREARESLLLELEGSDDAGVDLYYIHGSDTDASETHSVVEMVLGDGRGHGGPAIPDDHYYGEPRYQPPAGPLCGDESAPPLPPAAAMLGRSGRTRRPRYGRAKVIQHVRIWQDIFRYDRETRRLLRLAIPFTCSAVIGTVSDLVLLIVFTATLGSDVTVACIMVDAIVGISSSFTGGCIEAVSSLASMAYGAENYELVGQYAQAGCVLYVLAEIPMIFFWGFAIEKILALMQFGETVIALADSYVWVVVVGNIISGVNEANLDLLEVVEREKYANVMYCISSVVHLGLVALFAYNVECDLITLGLLMLAIEAFFLFVNILVPYMKWWYSPFERGLFGEFVLFQDAVVVKHIIKTALPLSFGGVLAYAEWEMLILFAAFLGPAEIVAWTLLGSVWDVFESTTSAVGDASEVRCAYHLGGGRPALAKLSAYKSMFLAFATSLVATVIFLSLQNALPAWLTDDTTIQGMIRDLFPLIALGNVTMNIGMVCWSVVGAQGRYHLATSIATACSLLITIPLGGLLTIGLRIDLTGLTFAVVMGYTATATLMSTVVFMSDWEALSLSIQKKMAAEEAGEAAHAPLTEAAESATDLSDDHDVYVFAHTDQHSKQSYVAPRDPQVETAEKASVLSDGHMSVLLNGDNVPVVEGSQHSEQSIPQYPPSETAGIATNQSGEYARAPSMGDYVPVVDSSDQSYFTASMEVASGESFQQAKIGQSYEKRQEDCHAVAAEAPTVDQTASSHKQTIADGADEGWPLFSGPYSADVLSSVTFYRGVEPSKHRPQSRKATATSLVNPNTKLRCRPERQNLDDGLKRGRYFLDFEITPRKRVKRWKWESRKSF